MFEGLRNMAGMASLMKDLPRMQQRMEEVKQSLGDLRVEAVSAGNQVRVVATGALEVVSVEIDESIDGNLGQIVCDTVNTALRMAQQQAQHRLASVAEEMGLPMPPGGLNLPGGM